MCAIQLAIRFLIANYCTRWPCNLKGSHTMGGGHNLMNISAPLPLIKAIKWSDFQPNPSRRMDTGQYLSAANSEEKRNFYISVMEKLLYLNCFFMVNEKLTMNVNFLFIQRRAEIIVFSNSDTWLHTERLSFQISDFASKIQVFCNWLVGLRQGTTLQKGKWGGGR